MKFQMIMSRMICNDTFITKPKLPLKMKNYYGGFLFSVLRIFTWENHRTIYSRWARIFSTFYRSGMNKWKKSASLQILLLCKKYIHLGCQPGIVQMNSLWLCRTTSIRDLWLFRRRRVKCFHRGYHHKGLWKLLSSLLPSCFINITIINKSSIDMACPTLNFIFQIFLINNMKK